MNTFGQFPPMGTVDPTPYLYQIDAIKGIPVHAILSEADQVCPSSANTARMASIPTLTSRTLRSEGGFDHVGMLNNDASYVQSLINIMPAFSSAVSDPFVCPVIIEDVIVPVETCFLEEYIKEASPEKRKRRRSRSSSSSSSSSKSKSKKKSRKKGKKNKKRRRSLSSSSSSKSKSKKKSRSKSKKSRRRS